MNAWTEYRAINVRPEGDQEIYFKVPPHADNNVIWERARLAMLNAYGHRNVTAWTPVLDKETWIWAAQSKEIEDI